MNFTKKWLRGKYPKESGIVFKTISFKKALHNFQEGFFLEKIVENKQLLCYIFINTGAISSGG